MKREHNGSKAMIFDGLDLLLKKRNGPCLSIVVEFFGEPTRRKYNEGILKAALEKASLLLANYDCPAKERNYMIAELQRFALSFDASKCSQGLGIFIAPDITRLVFFPFSVNEIILVADSFEIREVLRLRQYLSPYYIVHLDNQGARLWVGHAGHVQEIRDGQFPVIYIPETDKKTSGAERKILRAKVEAGVK
ncbi:MAG TPA: hypothetical protein VG737_08200, partial [Cyclobacteriaceae bacterium]|nr:hypothetical protein [Cyclobacteriaceae bacterium]